ncbi:PilN domain-containing protein [Aliiglaciecola litoralis]
MKNRINFFRDELKPQIILLNLGFLVFLSVLSVCLIIAGWTWAELQYRESQHSIDTLLMNVKQKKFLVDTLREAKDSRTQDKSILAAIEKNQQELDVKLTILNELSNRESQRSNGFSALMQDLAANHQSSLWLTNILLDERKLYLQGTTSNSEALPKWISKLNQAQYFAGTEFAGARMVRNEQEMLNFVLSSELDDVKGGGK